MCVGGEDRIDVEYKDEIKAAKFFLVWFPLCAALSVVAILLVVHSYS